MNADQMMARCEVSGVPSIQLGSPCWQDSRYLSYLAIIRSFLHIERARLNRGPQSPSSSPLPRRSRLNLPPPKARSPAPSGPSKFEIHSLRVGAALLWSPASALTSDRRPRRVPASPAGAISGADNESFNGSLRDELLNGEIFYCLAEAKVLIEAWRLHYNTVRPHSSRGYRPPAPEAVPSPVPSSGSASLHLRPTLAMQAIMH